MHKSFEMYIAWCKENNLKAGYATTLDKYRAEVDICQN